MQDHEPSCKYWFAFSLLILLFCIANGNRDTSHLEKLQEDELAEATNVIEATVAMNSSSNSSVDKRLLNVRVHNHGHLQLQSKTGMDFVNKQQNAHKMLENGTAMVDVDSKINFQASRSSTDADQKGQTLQQSILNGSDVEAKINSSTSGSNMNADSKRQNVQNSLENNNSGKAMIDSKKKYKVTADPKDEQQKEEKVKKEEGNLFGTALSSVAKAVTNPRGFLDDMKEMQTFKGLLKAAIQAGPDQGYCLREGEFRGLGCLDEPVGEQLCKCRGMLELCWSPFDTSRIVKNLQSGNMKEAMEDGKALILGLCWTPWWLVCLVVGIGLIVLLVVLLAIRRVLKKKQQQQPNN